MMVSDRRRPLTPATPMQLQARCRPLSNRLVS